MTTVRGYTIEEGVSEEIVKWLGERKNEKYLSQIDGTTAQVMWVSNDTEVTNKESFLKLLHNNPKTVQQMIGDDTINRQTGVPYTEDERCFLALWCIDHRELPEDVAFPLEYGAIPADGAFTVSEIDTFFRQSANSARVQENLHSVNNHTWRTRLWDNKESQMLALQDTLRSAQHTPLDVPARPQYQEPTPPTAEELLAATAKVEQKKIVEREKAEADKINDAWLAMVEVDVVVAKSYTDEAFTQDIDTLRADFGFAEPTSGKFAPITEQAIANLVTEIQKSGLPIKLQYQLYNKITGVVLEQWKSRVDQFRPQMTPHQQTAMVFDILRDEGQLPPQIMERLRPNKDAPVLGCQYLIDGRAQLLANLKPPQLTPEKQLEQQTKNIANLVKITSNLDGGPRDKSYEYSFSPSSLTLINGALAQMHAIPNLSPEKQEFVLQELSCAVATWYKTQKEKITTQKQDPENCCPPINREHEIAKLDAQIEKLPPELIDRVKAEIQVG